MNRVILVPRRPDHGERDKLWKFAEKYWEDLGIPICEGQDLRDAPFNRSLALNVAAETCGDWDTAILLDSDVLVDLEVVQQGIELAEETGRVVHPFRTWKGLGPQLTAKILTGFDGSWERGIHKIYHDNISACVIVPRTVWKATGGFDERFSGWGWEDSAWMWAVRCLTDANLRLKGDLWHLWHAPSPEKNSKLPEYQANKELALRYHSAASEPSAMLKILSEEGGPLHDS